VKVAVFTCGSLGDVRPFLALSCGLREAGYDVIFGGPDRYRDFIQSFRFPFFQLGPRWDPEEFRRTMAQVIAQRRPLKQLATLANLSAMADGSRVAQDCRQVCDHIQREGTDLILSHAFFTPGRIVAEVVGKPWVTATLGPFGIPTDRRPPRGLRSLGRWMNRRLWGLIGAVGRWRLDKLLNQPRVACGLSPLRNYLTEGLYSPRLNLVAASRHFPFGQEGWAPDHHLTGFWFLQDSAGWEPPGKLKRFLDAGPAPVYAGFGSAVPFDPGILQRVVLPALAMTGQRAVVAVGPGASLGDLPSTILPVDRVPFDWLLPRMAAAVTHGGAGTVAACLQAGRPVVVCSFFGDQPAWGRLVSSMGVGPKAIPYRKLNAHRLARAIDRAATDRGIARVANDLGQKLRSEHGVATAVSLIERAV